MKNIASGILFLAGFIILACEGDPMDSTPLEQVIAIKSIGVLMIAFAYIIGSYKKSDGETEQRHNS